MALVIRTIQVLAIPARGEYDSSADSARAHRAGEGCRVAGGARGAIASHDAVTGLETAVADIGEVSGLAAECRVSCEHSETLGKAVVKGFTHVK